MPAQPSQGREWIQVALDRFERPLLRYAARLTGNTETARDVVQDTFLKLCAADRERVESHLAAWLYTVCRNRGLDICRKERRMMPWTDALAQTHGVSDPPLSAAMEAGERHSLILDALGSLSPNQQEVIRLKFQGALSYREISEVTGLSVSNVGFLIHAAIKQIRRQIGAEPRANEA